MPLPPPPPPPTEHPATPTSSALSAPTRALAASIAVLLVAGVLTVLTRLGDDTSYPDEWDPRVAGLIDFVEQGRGLRFDHPVPVDFLTPEEYSEAVSFDVGELTEEEREAEAAQLAVFRALGVAEGDIDLTEAANQVLDAGTLAFYSPEDQRIRVRGSEVTVALRVTLVHELVHALQDQSFDLGDLLGSAEDVGQATARRALGEGDALRIENDYIRGELSDEEQATYDQLHQEEVVAGEAGTSDVPDVVQAGFALPYALGEPFLNALVADGGNRRVDDAFDEPPSTVEHLFDPSSFLAGEGATDPRSGIDDDDVIEEFVFGSADWFLILGQRIDPAQAFAAALGWNGDTAVHFERDGRACVRAVFAGDTDRDEDEMGSAIDAWAAAMPGGLAERVTVGDRPGLEACDPGPDADLGVRSISFDLLALPATWGYLAAEGTAQGLDPEESRCFARELLADTTLDELVDPEKVEELQDRFGTRALPSYSRCRSGDR